MKKSDTIGVVGAAGSLGGKLIVQVCSRFNNVYGFDVVPDERNAQTGVDPLLLSSDVINKASSVARLDDILENCDVIHWAAPIESARTIPRLPGNALLVLHDSLMGNSVEAAHELMKRKEIDGQIAVAHCLMYDSRTVAVASDIGQSEELVEHLAELGLVPKLMTYEKHDDVMAHEHGYWAVICKVFRPILEDYENRELLTPSAKRFLDAMQDNESRWTDVSYAAIVSNPKLEEVARLVYEKVRNGQHH